ncbi:hypothetical protein NON00_24215 [Roseomonas sp. GC11]|uniref:hypothetical protein n=1 Tax=Roseomonas sp. GC11 TaxID=2950546 RepID=UPI00210DA154|nr:hypothetical protein [Roseomonas sp. GC11]MCQ4163005.1 hypothetical protein [Roseomonas sp. GC11]
MENEHSDAELFRAKLEELDMTQASFARWMLEHGDNRPIQTIARNVRRIANGEAKLSGEMRIILHFASQAQGK